MPPRGQLPTPVAAPPPPCSPRSPSRGVAQRLKPLRFASSAGSVARPTNDETAAQRLSRKFGANGNTRFRPDRAAAGRAGNTRPLAAARDGGDRRSAHTCRQPRLKRLNSSCAAIFCGCGHVAAGSPRILRDARIRLPQHPRAIFFLLVGPKATPQRPSPRPGPAAVAAAGPQRVRTAVAAQWWHEQRGWRWSVARCRHLHTHRRLASPVRAPRAQSPRTSLHRPRRRRPGRCGHRDSAAATREAPRSTRGG